MALWRTITPQGAGKQGCRESSGPTFRRKLLGKGPLPIWPTPHLSRYPWLMPRSKPTSQTFYCQLSPHGHPVTRVLCSIF